ncbi:MAG: type II toxin-antitoxin system MqsA family antitoxin [Bacteroidales bacterium]
MKCVICRHGETEEGLVTVTVTKESTVVIIKLVPAQVCINCGEYYLSETVALRVYQIAEEAVRKGLEIEILKYAA